MKETPTHIAPESVQNRTDARRHPNKRKKREGAAAVEGIMVLPIFLLLIALLFWARDAHNAAVIAIEAARNSALDVASQPFCGLNPAVPGSGGAASCPVSTVAGPAQNALTGIVGVLDQIQLTWIKAMLPTGLSATTCTKAAPPLTAFTGGLGRAASVNFTSNSSYVCVEPTWPSNPDMATLIQKETARRQVWLNADPRAANVSPGQDVADAVYCTFSSFCPPAP